LYIVYLLTDDPQNASKESEMLKAVGQHIRDLTRKYSALLKASSQIFEQRAKISNLSMYNSDSYRQLVTVEHITRNLSAESLILLASPCVELQSEFLNRVRLNTIRNTQVFFPIPFYEYMPNIVYPSVPYPAQVDIHKTVGYFNRHSYNFAAFYNSDFIRTKSMIMKTDDKINFAETYPDDLYGLFAANNQLHILRTTDQALKCRWHLIDACVENQKRFSEEQWRCIKQRENSLGTKAQLAMHLMKNFDTISRK
jgi:hypothetical protein